MNLIEQLGGYENVSKHFNRVEYHAETKIFIGEWFGFYSMRDLKDALLDYRRQHNIFEHGDKIIVDWDACQIFTVDLVFPEIRLISALGFSGNKVGNASFDRIKHATDAEIKAGKRL